MRHRHRRSRRRRSGGEKHGARVVMEKAPIPTVGVLTKFEDMEGNVLSAMAMNGAHERQPNS